MQLTSYAIGPVAVLELAGAFDTTSAPVVGAWLEQATSGGEPQIVINLAAVSTIDATALVTLTRALRRCETRRGALHLCGLQYQVLMVFELTRLSRAFRIFVDTEHAVRALGQPDAQPESAPDYAPLLERAVAQDSY